MTSATKLFKSSRGSDNSSGASSKQKSSSKGQEDTLLMSASVAHAEPHDQGNRGMELHRLTLADYINASFGGDALVNLVAMADSRDELIKGATAGFFPDVITGCVDVSMAIVEAMLKFADSVDQEALSSEEVMRARVKLFILSVLDAVYGPNCVRITVYNPEVDWSVSLWQMFPVVDSPSSRGFLTQVPSQSDTVIQWLDLKSQLIKQCRNPKREAQRVHKITSLEDELQELGLRHAAMIERFIKIQQGEKDPEAAQAKREAEAARLQARKLKYRQVIATKHRVVDPALRTKRDAFLWGGVPHLQATMVSLNNSTMSKAESLTERVRRISRFGFRSDGGPDDDLDDHSSESSEGQDPDLLANHPDAKSKSNVVGCLSIFKCCGTQKRRTSLS